MTAVFYPDCRATSPNDRFTLEARSPDNGTIRYADGRRPDGRRHAARGPVVTLLAYPTECGFKFGRRD